MKVDYSPAAIAERLRRVGEVTSFRPEDRLRTKIDYSPEGIRARLDEVSRLLALCTVLGGEPGPRRPGGQRASTTGVGTAMASPERTSK